MHTDLPTVYVCLCIYWECMFILAAGWIWGCGASVRQIQQLPSQNHL